MRKFDLVNEEDGKVIVRDVQVDESQASIDTEADDTIVHLKAGFVILDDDRKFKIMVVRGKELIVREIT